MSIKSSNDTIRNRTRDLPTCNAVPRPTAPPRTPLSLLLWKVYKLILKEFVVDVNKNPTDATICRYLFTAKLSYMFRVSQHPSSGVSKTVPATSGTGHTTCTATPLLRGLVQTRPRRRGVAVQVVWPVPEAAGTVFDTPDDGCCDTRNM